MDSGDIEEKQANQIHESIAGMVRYLCRLEERMKRRGFPEDDTLRHHVARAQRELRGLSTITFYLTTGIVQREIEARKRLAERLARDNPAPPKVEDRRPLPEIADLLAKSFNE